MEKVYDWKGRVIIALLVVGIILSSAVVVTAIRTKVLYKKCYAELIPGHHPNITESEYRYLQKIRCDVLAGVI